MPKTTSTIRTEAGLMVAHFTNLRAAQSDYERMSRLEYDLPKPLAEWEWVNPVTSTAPFDALRGATRALANHAPSLEIDPATVLKALHRKNPDLPSWSQEARELANCWEKVIKYQVNRASNRRAAFRSSIMWSGATYDEMCAIAIHLPTQFKARGISKVRERAALRFGDWAFRILNPQSIATMYSDYMPERTLICRHVTAQELVDTYPDKSKAIADKIANDEGHAFTPYMEWDFLDYEQRYIYAVEDGDESSADASEAIDLFDPNPWLTHNGEPVPFLPIVHVAGGTETDAEPEYQRKPILFAVRQAEQWAITNIMQTIIFSMAQAEAAAPVDVVTGPGSKSVRIDYSAPAGRVNLTNLQKYERIRRAGLDGAMVEAFDRIEAAIRRSTVADVLVTGNPAPTIQAGYAYNIQIQTALASLGDLKEEGERFFDRLEETMLLITHYTGGKMVGYSTEKDSEGAGRMYEIDSEDIDPNVIHLRNELKPDVPSDRQQRLLAGVQMSQSLPYSPIRVLKFLGETDPEGALLEYKLWKLDLTDWDAKLERLKREVSGQYEKDVMAAAQQIIQQQMAQMNKGPQLTSGNGAGPGKTPPSPGMEGVPGVGGAAFDTTQGGLPTAAVAPGATRENQTGMAGGVPLVGA